jgi:ATP-binding cassette subfamily B protein
MRATITMLNGSVRTIVTVRIQLTVVAAERVFELLDEPEESPDAAAASVITAPRGAVQFDHVGFRYKPDVPVISDLSLDVAPGKTIAIVGPTGAGKTTLVNLLMRFYDVDTGAIRVDGVDVRQLKRGALRRMFGMVLQDTWLFSGTIRENIAYGRDGASEADIVHAAQMAQADHFIRTLPDNYDTAINEEAINLSQGQKQLLTIARAFLADPAVLILDEATSSVDSRTEVLIQQAMAELMRGRTTFVIAHRLSTIRNADTILMVEGGRIVERGTHDDLLAAAGRYAALYHSQFAGRQQIVSA